MYSSYQHNVFTRDGGGDRCTQPVTYFRAKTPKCRHLMWYERDSILDKFDLEDGLHILHRLKAERNRPLLCSHEKCVPNEVLPATNTSTYKILVALVVSCAFYGDWRTTYPDLIRARRTPLVYTHRELCFDPPINAAAAYLFSQILHQPFATETTGDCPPSVSWASFFLSLFRTITTHTADGKYSLMLCFLPGSSSSQAQDIGRWSKKQKSMACSTVNLT